MFSKSLPSGRCAPCFSRMPNGNRHVPCASCIPARKSSAVSSSQWTESLVCAVAVAAHTSASERKRRNMVPPKRRILALVTRTFLRKNVDVEDTEFHSRYLLLLSGKSAPSPLFASNTAVNQRLLSLQRQFPSDTGRTSG